MFFQDELNSARQKHADLFVESFKTWLRRTSQVTLQPKLDVDISWGLLPFAELKRVLSNRDKKMICWIHIYFFFTKSPYIQSQSSQAGLWIAKGWTKKSPGLPFTYQDWKFQTMMFRKRKTSDRAKAQATLF